MKYFFFLLFINASIVVAQECRVNLVNPPDLLNELSDMRYRKEYDKILELLNEKRQSDSISDICYYHQVACYLSLKRDTITPFLYIDSSLQLNSFPEHIFSEIDFTNLQKTQQWKISTNTLIQIYLSRYPDITNKQLSVELWLRGIEDQKTRSLRQNHYKDIIKRGSREWRKRQKAFRKITSDNAAFMGKWIESHNWPYYSEVGREAGDAAVLFIAHSTKKEIYKNTLPAIKQAIDVKESDAYWYAVTYDRYCSDIGGKQVYGTLIYRHGVSETSEGELIMSEWKLAPIEDEKNVDIRRASIGLEPLKDYVKKWGIDYEYNPEKEFNEVSSKDRKRRK